MLVHSVRRVFATQVFEFPSHIEGHPTCTQAPQERRLASTVVSVTRGGRRTHGGELQPWFPTVPQAPIGFKREAHSRRCAGSVSACQTFFPASGAVL